jgi:SAM-dependent methyltransferase
MSDPAAGLYQEKHQGYFSAPRFDLLQMLPPGGDLKLLELGAAHGATLRAAKERGIAAYAVGVDLVEPPSLDGIDRFIHGDVESMTLDLPIDFFDVVLCADVLEHLVDPWRAVRLLTRHLRPGGLIVSSIPNFRNHRVLSAIVVRGNFGYAEAGLLDRTHLRFFCRQNIRELFEQAGLVVEAMETNMGGYGWRHKALDYGSFRLFHDFFVFQFRTRARKL